MQGISEIIRSKFPRKSVLIVGDLVADQFLSGTIARVSREAPVLILSHETTETLAGAAANAAVNVASMGGNPLLIGLTGVDENGKLLRSTLDGLGVDCRYIVSDGAVRTTTKVRVLAGQHYAPRQQVIRIDYENNTGIGKELREKLIENLQEAGKRADAIVISDYNYGVADAEIVKLARSISREREIPLVIDSRFRLDLFPDAMSATPNQEEVEHLLGKDFSDEDCEELRRRLMFVALLVTRGNKGMLLFEEGRQPLRLGPIGSTEPVDVTGAGDTVIAAYALGLASGLTFREAASVANHAGGIVVMKKGTASVKASELIESIERERELQFSGSAA